MNGRPAARKSIGLRNVATSRGRRRASRSTLEDRECKERTARNGNRHVAAALLAPPAGLAILLDFHPNPHLLLLFLVGLLLILREAVRVDLRDVRGIERRRGAVVLQQNQTPDARHKRRRRATGPSCGC